MTEHIRQTTHLIIPSAEFELCINGKPLPYIAKQNIEMGYYFDNDTFRQLDKMYEIWLNAADFKKGDVVTGKIIGVPLNPDTTDECTINLLGVKRRHILRSRHCGFKLGTNRTSIVYNRHYRWRI